MKLKLVLFSASLPQVQQIFFTRRYFFLFLSISKCVLRCILTTRIGAIASDRWSRQGYVQVGLLSIPGFRRERQRNRRVTWDGSGPLRLPPRSPKVESSAERGSIQTLGERWALRFFSPLHLRDAREGRKATTRRGQLGNLWHHNYRRYSRRILHVSSVSPPPGSRRPPLDAFPAPCDTWHARRKSIPVFYANIL